MLVGVPLTLLQIVFNAHNHIGLDAGIIANNFAMSHAIYDADRIGGDFYDRPRWTTSAAAIGSAVYFASDVHTIGLAPCVLILSAQYAQIKTHVASWKPAFVGAVWAVAIGLLPAMHASRLSDVDPHTVATVFASLTALSHLKDIDDIDEDVDAGVFTPAVRMGEEEALAYAVAAILAASYVHSVSSSAWWPYDYACIASVASRVSTPTRQSQVFALLIFSAVVVAAATHPDDVVIWLLRSSDLPHRASIEAMSNLMHTASHLPPSWRRGFVDGVMDVMEMGDATGRALLSIYREILRGSI